MSANDPHWIIRGISAGNINKGRVSLRQSNYIYGENGANCQVILRDITQSRLDYMSENTGALVDILLDSTQDESFYQTDELAWKPYILVDNCVNASIHFSAKGYVKVVNSSVASIDRFNFVSGTGNTSYPEADLFINVDNSNIKPVLTHPTNDTHRLEASLFTSSSWGFASNHDGTRAQVTLLADVEGFGNRPAQNTLVTDIVNFPDGFFEIPAGQITNANGTNNTDTLNAVLTALRDQGLIDR